MSNAIDRGKGLFVLAATSNPEGKALQTANVSPSKTIATDIWQRLAKINSVTSAPSSSLGSFGAVVGATLDLRGFGLVLDESESTLATPILAPGFGAQGAELADAKRLFGANSDALIASVSRSVLRAGARGVSAAIESSATELNNAMGN